MLVHTLYMQLAMSMQTPSRFLCFDGNIYAICAAEYTAIRIRIVTKNVLARNESIMVAIGALCANTHSKNIFTDNQNSYVKPFYTGKAIA